jgi:hypothetical protein
VPPSEVTLTLSNQKFCDQDDVGGENSGGRLFAPPDLYKAVFVEGTYTLKQDIFGPYKRLETRTNQVISGAVAGNCVNYSYYRGNSFSMTVGRWPPDAGSFYWLSFSSGDMSMESVFLGGGMYDICASVGGRFDARASFEIRQNGSAVKVTGAGRQWSVYACVDVTISR